MVNRMITRSGGTPTKISNQSNDSPTEKKCSVKSFYGKKVTNLRWTKKPAPNKDITLNDVEFEQRHERDEKKLAPAGEENSTLAPPDEKIQPVRRFYKRDDVFWTTNVYGKKRKTESKQAPQEIQRKERKISIEDSPISQRIQCSIETQTSFSSSQEGSQPSICSSPLAIARSSPFFNQPESKDSTLNEFSEIELNADDASNSDDSEPYEMFNCDTSSSQLNSSIRSNEQTSSSPRKKTPTRKKSPTLLNYFTKVNRSGGCKTSKLAASPRDDVTDVSEAKKKKNKKQLHFSKSGLSAKNNAEERYDF